MIVDNDDIIQKRLDAGMCPHCSSRSLEERQFDLRCRICGLVIGESRDKEDYDFATTNGTGSLS